MSPHILAISGTSGAGKTTLIEAVIPRLAARGLAVGVLKHDAHGLDLDRPGKDTHRLREAGAVRVEAFDGTWWFQVAPTPAGAGWDWLPAGFRRDVDILLVEGGKTGPMDKIWISGPGGGPDGSIERVIAIVGRGDAGLLESSIVSWLESRWLEASRGAVVLAGGESRRMGRPKPSIPLAGGTLLDHVEGIARSFAPEVLVAGPGHVPDAPGVPGPLGGILAAMRWDPDRTWIVLACDMPRLRREVLDWLWSLRRPGTWAVIPLGPSSVPNALVAVYEPQAARLLEHAAARGELSPCFILEKHPKVRIVEPPRDLVEALEDVDTPEDLARLGGEG